MHENGEVRCLSEDLSEEYWNSNTKNTLPKHDSLQDRHVLRAAILSIDQARKTLLKSRGDVVAMLEADFDPTSSSTIPYLLVLISCNAENGDNRTKSALRMHIFNVSATKLPSDSSRIIGNFKSMKEMMVSLIPEPRGSSSRDSVFSLDERSGLLYQYGGKNLVIYNLTGPVPRVEQHIILDYQVSSCLHIGPSTAVLTSPSTISVLDTRYHSIHSSQSLERSYRDRVSKNAQLNMATNTRLLSYFANLDLVVGLHGQALVAFQLNESNADEPRSLKRTRGGKLINAIRRGINISKPTAGTDKATNAIPKTLGDSLPLCQSSKEWQEKRSQLDVHAAKGEAELFDRLMSSELGINRENENDHIPGTSVDHGRFTKPEQGLYSFDRQKVQYTLSKIFIFDRPWKATSSVDGSDIPVLKIGFLPLSTFRWLARNGFVSLQQVESALKQAGAMPIPATLSSDSMIQAFAIFDDSLQILVSILTGPTYFNPLEIATALRLSIQILRSSEGEEGIRTMTNGQSSIDQDSDNTMQVVSDEMDHITGSPSLSTGKVTEAKALMRACINRLKQYHSSDIVKSFKQHLPHNDIVSLIAHLRLDLARNGWLSRYTEDLPILPLQELAYTDSNTQISTAAKILNCAIDALGTAGWILGDSASPDSNILSAENGDTISYMKAEISAALEGIEEAAYLQGMLGEALLFYKSARGRSPDQEDTTHLSKKVKPITVPLEDRLAAALPLGMKAPSRVSLMKVGAGGEVQIRSARDVGRLKSRAVGKYSFERIVV